MDHETKNSETTDVDCREKNCMECNRIATCQTPNDEAREWKKFRQSWGVN